MEFHSYFHRSLWRGEIVSEFFVDEGKNSTVTCEEIKTGSRFFFFLVLFFFKVMLLRETWISYFSTIYKMRGKVYIVLLAHWLLRVKWQTNAHREKGILVSGSLSIRSKMFLCVFLFLPIKDTPLKIKSNKTLFVMF